MHILIDAAGRLNDIAQDEYVQILPTRSEGCPESVTTTDYVQRGRFELTTDNLDRERARMR